MTQTSNVHSIDSKQLKEWLQTGQAVLIDVREPDEFSDRHIPNAISMPLTDIKDHVVHLENNPHKIVFQCLKGTRGEMGAKAAYENLPNHPQVYNLTGGIEAWEEAGYDTVKQTQTTKLPMMRQVMIAAGSLVLLGTILNVSGIMLGIYIAMFVGAGLLFAGVTGWCGMALLLSKMPWNT